MGLEWSGRDSCVGPRMVQGFQVEARDSATLGCQGTLCDLCPDFLGDPTALQCATYHPARPHLQHQGWFILHRPAELAVFDVASFASSTKLLVSDFSGLGQLNLESTVLHQLAQFKSSI